MLTTFIPLVLTSDPVAKYAEIAATIPAGKRYVMDFDYSIKELPSLTRVEYLEDVYPTSPLLSPDLDLDSWEWKQGALASCGNFAAVCAYASIPRHLPISLENGIYPKEKNPYGLYFIRVAVGSGTRWMAIDSRYTLDAGGKLAFCKMMVDGSPFAPQLFFKSRAVAKGGGWDEVTNSESLKIEFPGWFPHLKESCLTFANFKQRFEQGTLATFTYAQQFDAIGAKITPTGIVYGHAFSLCDYLEVDEHKLVRVQNPWNSGSEPDWSAYGEASTFWSDRPELADKLQSSKVSGGNYWLSWEELTKRCSGGAVTTRTWTGIL